jgi:hypothetical protein
VADGARQGAHVGVTSKPLFPGIFLGEKRELAKNYPKKVVGIGGVSSIEAQNCIGNHTYQTAGKIDRVLSCSIMYCLYYVTFFP